MEEKMLYYIKPCVFFSLWIWFSRLPFSWVGTGDRVLASGMWLLPDLILMLLLLSCFSRVWLCDPMDCSLPGSSVHGIFQARTLDWVVISFSNAWKWKVKVESLSRVQLFATPWTAAYQAPPSMGFSRQEYWSGVPLPFPIKPPKWSFTLSVLACWL